MTLITEDELKADEKKSLEMVDHQGTILDFYFNSGSPKQMLRYIRTIRVQQRALRIIDFRWGQDEGSVSITIEQALEQAQRELDTEAE